MVQSRVHADGERAFGQVELPPRLVFAKGRSQRKRWIDGVLKHAHWRVRAQHAAHVAFGAARTDPDFFCRAHAQAIDELKQAQSEVAVTADPTVNMSDERHAKSAPRARKPT
jgi:hypothetical protein